MKPALLDVNVLLALAWPNHQHHASAHAWFAREARHGWASNGFTQLAFIRLSSNPAYTPQPATPGEAALLLSGLVAHRTHQFWASPAAARSENYVRAIGHQQVNDAYLIQAARQKAARLVTFDQRLEGIAGGGRVVHVIQPVSPTSA